MLQIQFVFILFPNGLVAGSGVCAQEDNSNRCCTNFKYDNGICTPCIGTFGINCSGGSCPLGYYGFGCLRKCFCSQYEQCDKIRGCVDEKTSEKHWSVRMVPVLLGIIFGGGTVLLTATVYLFKSLKPPQAVNYVEDIFLPREYDRPHNVSACYTRCNTQETDVFPHYTKQNVKSLDSSADPHIYLECI
ncbi:uncharacterized protein LOC111132422 isoform X1 [Crassostrea virginica]